MRDFLKTVLTVRKGSVRVKDKNFKPFNKKNLLSYKIDVLKKVKGIGEIIVNTDAEEAVKIVEKVVLAAAKEILILVKCTIVNFVHIADTDSIIYFSLTVQIL